MTSVVATTVQRVGERGWVDGWVGMADPSRYKRRKGEGRERVLWETGIREFIR